MWELRTGCRLHFGLMELAPQAPNRYAGLGVMIEQPSMIIRVGDSNKRRFAVTADSIDSASLAEYQQRIDSWLRQQDTAASIELLSGYPFHSGLGSGTQLACLLAVASKLLKDHPVQTETGSDQWRSIVQMLGDMDPTQLAAMSGRGLRSAIGLQGFLSGGLILDTGYRTAGDQSRTVDATVCRMSSDWCIVLIRGANNSSITGPLESQMIRSMAARPNPHRQRMMELAIQSLGFATAVDFEQCCGALEEYMRFAGEMFAPVQGGRYNGAVCSQAVAIARQLGLRAVGQSSWGPTIFGLCADAHRAREVATKIHQHGSNWHVQIAHPAQHGAIVRVVSDL
jgi:beta-ribofuranosylaminobenzene 5'-phosphate synthase